MLFTIFNLNFTDLKSYTSYLLIDEDNNEIPIDDNNNAKFIKEYKTTSYEFTIKCYHGNEKDFDFTINIVNGYQYQVDLTIDYDGNKLYNEY